MVRSRGERGPWENETSLQHSGGGDLYPGSGDMETGRWQNAGPREAGVSTWTISAPALLCRENSLFYG